MMDNEHNKLVINWFVFRRQSTGRCRNSFFRCFYRFFNFWRYKVVQKPLYHIVVSIYDVRENFYKLFNINLMDIFFPFFSRFEYTHSTSRRKRNYYKIVVVVAVVIVDCRHARNAYSHKYPSNVDVDNVLLSDLLHHSNESNGTH